MGEETLPSFPTYASLTQTAAWGATTARPVEGEQVEVELAAPRYIEGALLGAGGMGKVLLAHDARVGRDVAVKELHAQRTLSADERARFLREARVQGQLEHPSIVPVYDIDRRPDGTTFFTMRRVMGKTLHTILEELRAGDAAARAQYTLRELLSAFATVCLAIDYAHSRGVIHRDLKPANLMLGNFGEVYVLDWGLARLVNDSTLSGDSGRLSTPGEVMGTPLYMAPEQMNDPEVGVAADVFSLGAILFEVLTLVSLRDPKAPFVPGDARPSVRVPDRGVPPELETICVKATAADPNDRYASARALQQAVVRYLEGDRELERRRELAAQHVKNAKAALERADDSSADGEAERGRAMRELAKALAFDPSNADHVALLGQVLTQPPKFIPPTVREQLRAETNRIIHTYAEFSGPAMLTWFLFIPVLLVIGLRSWPALTLIAVSAAVASGTAFYASRQKWIGPGLQLAVIIFMLVAAIGTSRAFGPLILMPTLICAYAIVLQAHPSHRFRQVSLVVGALALTVPTVLELVGVLPSSYVFAGNRWTVLPQMIDLTESGTIGLIFATNLTMLLIPSMFIARLRADLSNVQARQLVQAWHFRRIGDELMAAAA